MRKIKTYPQRPTARHSAHTNLRVDRRMQTNLTINYLVIIPPSAEKIISSEMRLGLCAKAFCAAL